MLYYRRISYHCDIRGVRKDRSEEETAMGLSDSEVEETAEEDAGELATANEAICVHDMDEIQAIYDRLTRCFDEG